MTEEEMNNEAARRASDQIRMLEPILTQIAVLQATVAALIYTHPTPDLLRQRAESLLAQNQVALALLQTTAPPGGRSPKLPTDQVQKALGYLFRPVLNLDPE